MRRAELSRLRWLLGSWVQRQSGNGQLGTDLAAGADLGVRDLGVEVAIKEFSFGEIVELFGFSFGSLRGVVGGVVSVDNIMNGGCAGGVKANMNSEWGAGGCSGDQRWCLCCGVHGIGDVAGDII